jgi:beta-lactam-binding protein with PASTA domain
LRGDGNLSEAVDGRLIAWMITLVLALAGWPGAGAQESFSRGTLERLRPPQTAPPQPPMRDDRPVIATSVVPDLHGQGVAEARALLERSGLRFGEIDRVRTRGVPGGVVRQSPAAGEQIARGSAVKIWVGEAPLVEVPDLTGQPLAQAERLLARPDLRLGRVERVPSADPEDTVLRQHPPAGTPVEQASAVDVWIAMAVTVRVPDLLKRPLEDARDILDGSRLHLGEVTPQPSAAPEGTVLRQSPEPHQEVKPGTSVSLWVAGAAVVPNVVGRRLREAAAVLDKAGFEMQEEGQEESAYPEGTVARQAPEAAEGAPKGSRVRVWVAAPRLVRVPDLRGETPEAAEQQLKKRRLRLGPRSSEPPWPRGWYDRSLARGHNWRWVAR